MFRNTRASPAANTLAVVAVVQFMVSLDLTVVNVGLPRIASGLGFGPTGLPWVIHAYALTFGGLLLLGGAAADRYGRKRLLTAGLVLFGAASLLGGLAQSPGALVAARALQGLGAAAAAPAALALLTSTFPSGPERARAFGIWSAANAGGGAFGVLIGGLLTEYAGWRWVLLINVPMAAVALALSLRGLRSAPPDTTGRRAPDLLGALLGTAGMTLVVLGVVRTDRHPWGSAATLGTLSAAVALLALFWVVERRLERHGGTQPLIRLGLLANRSVSGANGFNLLLGAAMASAFYFVSLYLQRVLGTGPAEAGLQFLPFALGVIVGSVLAVRLGRHLGQRTLMITGGLLTAAGFAWFSRISPDGSFLADVLGPSVVASIGFGLALAPVVSTATEGVAAHEAGMASGLLNSSRQVGASLGLAVLGTAAAHRTGEGSTPADLTDGYALALILSAALLLGAVLIATAARRGASTSATREEPTPEDLAPAASPELVPAGVGPDGHRSEHLRAEHHENERSPS